MKKTNYSNQLHCLIPKALTVDVMYTITESDMDCGCCIELTVSDGNSTVTVVCHSAEEGIAKAKILLSN